jgi:hypothetical protein
VGVIAFGLALLIVSIKLPNLFGTTVREQPNAVAGSAAGHGPLDAARPVPDCGRSETDANLLPDWLKGEHKVLVAEGDVQASVDFSQSVTPSGCTEHDR